MSEPMKKASRSRCRNGRPRPHRRCVPSGLELHNQTPPVRRIVAVIVMGVLSAILAAGLLFFKGLRPRLVSPVAPQIRPISSLGLNERKCHINNSFVLLLPLASVRLLFPLGHPSLPKAFHDARDFRLVGRIVMGIH